MDARTALWPYGSAVPGPERDAAGPEGERGAQHRPDVAGVVDAPQRHAQRAGGRGRPALAVDRERARAGAELGDLRQQRLGDLLALEAGAGGDEAHRRLPARGRGGVEQVLALGHELTQLVAPLAARELADLGEGLVVGAGDHRVSVEKKAPVLFGGAPGASVSSALRPRTPRGRSGQSVGRSRHRARRCRPGPCGPARCRPA